MPNSLMLGFKKYKGIPNQHKKSQNLSFTKYTCIWVHKKNHYDLEVLQVVKWLLQKENRK